MAQRRLFRSLSLGVILCGGMLAGSPACSGTPSFDGSGGGGSDDNCVVADKSLCGVSCDNDNSCAAGLYCDMSTDTCQAECLAGDNASPHCDGAACAANGRCTGQTSSGGSGSGGTTGSGGGFNPPPGSGGQGGEGGNNCIDVNVTPTPIIPNVVLLIDRSLSMTGAAGFLEGVEESIAAGDYTPWTEGDNCEGPVPGAPTFPAPGDAEFWRWNVVRTVLFNPEDGVVTELGEVVRFGMTTYSSDEATLGECPTLVNVDLNFDNREAMLAGFACSDLILQTPTRESLAPTADALDALEVEGPKFIILATDGEPDNCACPDFNGGECDGAASIAEQEAVVAEAARVHDTLGITVHVVDVSSPTQTDLHDHLTEVATAGGGDIYNGTDPAGLIDAFRAIISDAQSCVIQLNGMVVAGQESNGTVTMGGEELTYEEDWIMPTLDQIELIDEACTTFKTESPTLSITLPCGDFVVK